MKVQDLYQQTTQRIIAELKEGVPPWTRPWKDDKRRGIGMIPSNLVTGRLYSGSNILLLWMTAALRGYSSFQFCTFNQANAMGAKVRKGEKSATVIFTKHTLKKDEKSGEDKPQTIVKAYPVFHLSQLDGVPDKYLVPQEQARSEIQSRTVREFVAGVGIPVEFGANKAAYYPARDVVVMPTVGMFESEDAFTGTLCHELTHATGHESRLARQFGKRFGDRAYAFEELVAELGSAFLCARLGISPTFRSASYIDSWLRILGDDHRAIFSAASYAGHASDWLWKQSFGEEQKQEEKTSEKQENEQAYSMSI